MSTACGNFRPHMWKPRQCAACFKSKAEHSVANGSSSNSSDQSEVTKQSSFYKKFSFNDDGEVAEKATSRDGESTGTQQQSTAPTSSAEVKLIKKPDNDKKLDETDEEQSPSLQTSVVKLNESNFNETSNRQEVFDDYAKLTGEVIKESNMSQDIPTRPPPPRMRSHTMAIPRVKPRRNIPEPSGLPPPTIKTLPRDLQPVPAPRSRTNRSTSPGRGSLDDSCVHRAKSLDNLDASSSSPPHTDRRVTFNSETTTIPDSKCNDPLTTSTKKPLVEPYAVSEVTDIRKTQQDSVVEEGSVRDDATEENDEHEYIEADQLNAAVVSVSELKNKHRNDRAKITKYATLSSLQPTQQQNGKLIMNGGVKQKALSSGMITATNTNKTAPRRQAPPPPGPSHSRTLTSSYNYSVPRRPPPPVTLYTNANVTTKSSKTSEGPVHKVPPAKPLRTPSTFDYENLDDSNTAKVEHSTTHGDVTSPTDDLALSRPKKPVRMPKEATPSSDSDAAQSSTGQPIIRGRYVDLDIDQLETDRQQRQKASTVMKYQNFDDFSPRTSPDLTLDSFDAFSTSLPPEGAAQIHDAIMNSLNVASTELSKFYFGQFSFVGKATCSKWSDFEPVGVAPPGTTPCVKYNGKLLSLQDFSKERVEGEKATLLPPHPNICRALAFFTDNPPSKLVHKFKIKKGRVIAITDTVPITTVSEFVNQNFISMKQLEYDRHVLLILAQLFSALKHLQQNGTVHRDLSAETCRYDPKSGILKITDFTYALYRPPPITSSTFLYGYGELKWLGGTGSKLPPEIINTPDDCQTLDYSMSDSFAAGCMIYEVFGMQPPFDKDENLISKNYTRDDLPHIPKRSQYSNLINHLIYLLLQVDTSKRIKPHTALLLVQAILWAPVSWIHDTVSEVAIQSYLAVEKARLVTSVALNSLKGDGKPSVELLLKNMFIQECNPSDLINALSLLNTE